MSLFSKPLMRLVPTSPLIHLGSHRSLLTPQWSSSPTCEARTTHSSWLSGRWVHLHLGDIIWWQNNRRWKNPPPALSPLLYLASIWSNNVIYLAAFRTWHAGHLKQAHSAVSLKASQQPRLCVWQDSRPCSQQAPCQLCRQPAAWLGQIILLLCATSSISTFFSPKLFRTDLLLSLFNRRQKEDVKVYEGHLTLPWYIKIIMNIFKYILFL